jgi:hypothetical protein
MKSKSYRVGQFSLKPPSYGFITLPFWLSGGQAVQGTPFNSWAVAWRSSGTGASGDFHRGVVTDQPTHVVEVIEVLIKPKSWYSHPRSTPIHASGLLGGKTVTPLRSQTNPWGGSVVTRIMFWGLSSSIHPGVGDRVCFLSRICGVRRLSSGAHFAAIGGLAPATESTKERGTAVNRFVGVILVLLSSLFAVHGARALPPIIEWEKTLQGDGAWCVQQTADGGYFLTGQFYHPGREEMHLIRTNQSGDTLWTRLVGNVSAASVGRSGRECYDGSFIAVGYYGMDAYVVKENSSGGTLWTKRFSAFDPYYGNIALCVRETMDHGYIISGYSNIWGHGDDALVIKLDQNGNKGFMLLYGGPQYEWANDIIQTPDLGFIAVGSWRPVSTPEYYNQYWILKIDSVGTQEWLKTYGGPYADILNAICPAGDGGYLVAGYTDSQGTGYYDFSLMKINSSGDSLWTKTYGSSTDVDRCYSMAQMGDGSFVLAGRSTSHGMAVGVNANGDQLWKKDIPQASGWGSAVFAVDATEDDGFIVAGAMDPDNHTYLVKLGPDPTGVGEDPWNGLPAGFELRQNLPNPFNPTTTISFTIPERTRATLLIYDVQGRLVRTLVDEMVGEGYQERIWDGKDANGSPVGSGVYFYRLTAGDKTLTKKMVHLK